MSVENLKKSIKREKTTPERVKKENKSSNEILSELFGVFNATPPRITESPENNRKRAKKEKKQKKDKKRSRRDSSSSSSSSDSDRRHRYKKKKSKRRRSSSRSSRRSRSRSRERKPKLESIKTEKPKVKTEVKTESIKTEEPRKSDSRPEPKKETTPVRDDKCSIKLIKSEDAINIPLPEEPKENNMHDTKQTSYTKQAETDSDKTTAPKGTKGIQIKNLKFSTVYEETVKKAEEAARKRREACEEGEYTDSSSGEPVIQNNSQFPKTNDVSELTKEKDDFEKSKKLSRDGSRSRRRSTEKSHKSSKSRHRSRSKHRSKSSRRSRSGSRSRHRSRSRDRKKRRSRSRSFGRSSRRHNNLKLGPRKSRSPVVRLADAEKKRLLEVARRNAINMLKNGAVPAAAAALPPHTRREVMTAIQSGGKSVDELTDFCKHLSKKEALGELSSASDRSDSENEDTIAFHHPFLVKEKAPIVMNIRGGVPLPVKSGPLAIQSKEELSLQFPVSSGTQHRGSEKEWRAVTPPSTRDNQIAKLNHKPAPKSSTTASKSHSEPLALPAPAAAAVPAPEPTTAKSIMGGSHLAMIPSLPAPGPQAYPPGVPHQPPPQAVLDITSLVTQKLSAIRQESEKSLIPAATGLGFRATSKLGAFNGSTGASILTPRELASGSQAWAKKDQLTRAAPVSGGMGMHLLQKMGWTPGKGLGKEETGALQPLLLEVKLDTKGLQAKEEQQRRRARGGRHGGGGAGGGGGSNLSALSGVSNKHPVSLLGEYCSKRKLGPPEYELCFECGPDHKKNFLFKVKVAGVEYQPSVASINKKQAKADSALIALQKLGVLP